MSPNRQRRSKRRRVRERDIDKSVKIMSPMPAPPSWPRPCFPLPPLQTFESYIRDKTVETMSRLFPVPTTFRDLMRKTYVLWDMSDYSIPENLDPYSIMFQIESYIQKEGYLGELQIWLYGAENTWSCELIDELAELQFNVCPFKGVKLARLNLIIAYFLASVFVMDAPTNLLMLSSNKEEMEQEPKFLRVRKILEDRGFCVVSAQPETLINPDAPACDHDQIGPEMLASFQS